MVLVKVVHWWDSVKARIAVVKTRLRGLETVIGQLEFAVIFSKWPRDALLWIEFILADLRI